MIGKNELLVVMFVVVTLFGTIAFLEYLEKRPVGTVVNKVAMFENVSGVSYEVFSINDKCFVVVSTLRGVHGASQAEIGCASK